MTTTRTRVIVSVVASTIVTFVLGACAGGRARPGSDGTTAIPAPSATVFFDNDGRDYVHVYMVSDRRQWYLGRVEAGARRSLRVPEEAIVTSPQRLQLAVMIGQQLTPRVVGEPAAMFTIAQPAARLLSQDWSLAQGQLVSSPIGRARVGGVHP